MTKQAWVDSVSGSCLHFVVMEKHSIATLGTYWMSTLSHSICANLPLEIVECLVTKSKVFIEGNAILDPAVV